MAGSDSYISAAITNESAIVANALSSTRNHTLNRAAFKLGTIPGMTTDTAINALLLAAGANGYIKEHGESTARKVIESGLRNGQSNPRPPFQSRPNQRLPSQQAVARAPQVTSEVVPASASTKVADPVMPVRTAPDSEGKPTFHPWGIEGPPRRPDEKRRHIYRRDTLPVRIKVMNRGGGAVNWYRVQNSDGCLGWQARKPEGFLEVPYLGGGGPFDREVTADDLYWPEGEKDVDSIVRLGALAITFGGTGDGLPAGCEACFVGRNVIILADNDEGGRRHAEQKAALIHPVAQGVRIVHFAELPEKGDVSDWIALGKDRDDLQRRVDETPLWSSPSMVESPSIAGLDVLCMSDVRPTSIVYLWPNWLALGKVHVLAGEGGNGKTTILHDWTARTTTGDRWPDGAKGHLPGGVLILASEDDVEDTIAPRLIAAGADMSRVFVIRSVRDEQNRRRGFSLQADLERLEAEIKKRDNILLVIFDPISSYLGKVDSHNNSDVRSILDPLGEFAARLRVAIVCNNHFSKGGGNANSRIIGSVAFVNQARAAFIVTPDEQDETRMLLIPSKMNIAPLSHGLAYRIEGCLIEHGGTSISTSRIMYESTPITLTANQALAAVGDSEDSKSAKAEATEFLLEALGAGPLPAKEVKREATEAGISPKSLRNAREALGIKSEKSGFDGGWVWNLPKMPKEPQDARL
jgi:putative DNA primase/helicase